jgi:hypothetical protein
MTQTAPSVPASPQPLGATQERRRQRRRRVLKEGKLIFGATHTIVDCAIDNESGEGAHVRVSSWAGVPADLYLVEASRGVIHKAEVAWRTMGGIGLRISGPLQDSAEREALLRKFRR